MTDMVIETPVADLNENLMMLDIMLAAVTTRSTVYAAEILDALARIDHPACAACIATLTPFVAHVDDTDYLHARDFLNPLLDLRSEIAA